MKRLREQTAPHPSSFWLAQLPHELLQTIASHLDARNLRHLISSLLIEYNIYVSDVASRDASEYSPEATRQLARLQSLLKACLPVIYAECARRQVTAICEHVACQ